MLYYFNKKHCLIFPSCFFVQHLFQRIIFHLHLPSERDNNSFLFCARLLTHPTGLSSSSPHTPISSQWDISVTFLLSRKPHGAPRAQVPLHPCDGTPQICSVYDGSYTCDSLANFHTPETPSVPPAPQKKHSALTHIIHFQVCDTDEGQGGGTQPRLRCKTPPACFNFHLPHHDPLPLVTRAASRCTSVFSSPVCPWRILSPHSAHPYLWRACLTFLGFIGVSNKTSFFLLAGVHTHDETW